MTRPGVIFVAALTGIWAAALYSGNNLLYLCGAALLALAAGAIWRGIRLLHGLPNLQAQLPLLEACAARVLREPLRMQQPDSPAVIAVKLPDEGGELFSRYALQIRCAGGQARPC